jgi:HK97 family phage major capsid protein
MAQYKGLEINLVPTDAMVSEAERALAWRKEFGRGGTEVGIARARDISNKVDLSPDTIRRMTSFFARHEVDKQAEGFRQGEDGYPSNGRIAWALWGGDPGRTWAEGKASRMDKIDETGRAAPDELKNSDFVVDQAEVYPKDVQMRHSIMELEKRHIIDVAESDKAYVITFAKADAEYEDEPAMAEEAQPEVPSMEDVQEPMIDNNNMQKASGSPTEVRHRGYEMGANPVNKDERRVQIAMSSEKPVARSFGMEVLDHDPSSIDVSFLNSGRAPLLLDHDPEKQIGIIEEVRIDGSARVMRATVRFGKGGLATEVFNDVVDGIRQNISVGYQVNKMVREDGGDGTVFRVNKWTPIEASIVSLPADSSVGVGRSIEIISTPIQEIKMSEVNHDEMRSAIVKQNAEIIETGARLNKRDIAEKAIARGLSLEQFRGELIESFGSTALGNGTHEVGLNKRERSSYSLMRAINAQARQDWSEAGFERELSDEIGKRVGRTARGFYVPSDMAWSKRDVISGTATSTSKGGYMIGTDQRGDLFIDALRDTLVTAGLGATMLTGLQGNVAIPKLATKTTVAFVAETSAPTEGAPVFGQLTMQPRTVAGYVDISRRMIIQSDPSVEMVLRNDIINQIAAKIDDVAIKGGGSNEPTGILGTSGIGAVAIGTNGGAPTWAMVNNIQRAVDIANANTGALSYLTNPKVTAKLRTTAKQSSGVEGNFILGELNTLLGYGIASTNLVPSTLTKGTTTATCSALLYGNFNELVIGMWSGVDIVVDTASLSTAGGLRLAFFQDVDVGVRHAESFAACQDITTV